MGEIDLKYSLSLLKEINNLEIKDKNISSFFNFQGNNLWHFYQHDIFSDIKEFSKNKKVKKTPYISVTHNIFAGLLSNLFTELALWASLFKKPRVFIYGVDKYAKPYGADNRVRDLYKFLHDKEISYREILHSVSGSEMRKNLLSRKRFAVSVESFDYLWSFLHSLRLVSTPLVEFLKDEHFSSFAEQERILVKKIIEKCARLYYISIFKIKCYEAIFSFFRPRAIFLIDDGRRHYYEILLAARRAHISSTAIQHGQYNEYFLTPWRAWSSFVGAYSYPDTYYVWSEYWKNELIEIGTFVPSWNIKIGGIMSLEKNILSFDINSNQTKDKEITYVILPYEATAPKAELTPYLKNLVACGGFKLVFKTRADVSSDKQVADYNLSQFKEGTVIVTNSLSSYIKEDTIMVGVYSTLLYEAIFYKIPVAILDTSSDYAKNMIKNKLAILINKDDDVCSVIKDLGATSDSAREKIKETVFGTSPNTIYSTLSSSFGNIV